MKGQRCLFATPIRPRVYSERFGRRDLEWKCNKRHIDVHERRFWQHYYLSTDGTFGDGFGPSSEVAWTTTTILAFGDSTKHRRQPKRTSIVGRSSISGAAAAVKSELASFSLFLDESTWTKATEGGQYLCRDIETIERRWNLPYGRRKAAIVHQSKRAKSKKSTREPHFFEFFSLYWIHGILHDARRFLPPKDCVPAFLY
jgi:hypothetical protein